MYHTIIFNLVVSIYIKWTPACNGKGPSPLGFCYRQVLL
jgi:hypothetical protein